MSRGSSSLGGGGFSGGHGGGGHSYSSGNGGLFTGLVIGSLLSRRNGSSSSSGDGNNEDIKYKKVRNQKATLITCGVLLAFTILFIVLSIVFRFDAVYAKTTATATDYDYRYDWEQGQAFYYTTYEFELESQVYSVESQVGWTKLEHMEGKEYTETNIQTYYLGKEYQIYFQKSNPYKIYEVEAKGDMPSTNGLYIFFAVLFGILVIIIYLTGINKYEIDQEYVQAKQKMEEAKMPEGKRKCGYCGGIIDASSNKCPHCGASTK